MIYLSGVWDGFVLCLPIQLCLLRHGSDKLRYNMCRLYDRIVGYGANYYRKIKLECTSGKQIEKD